MAVSTLSKDYMRVHGKAQLYRIVHYKLICTEKNVSYILFWFVIPNGLLIVQRPTAVRIGAEA